MAKEVELKKIELRVSANCCEGCKKKVKKALRNVEGVLKTEIDPLQPKMTVLGNVNPQILIKKLLKIGKHAEIYSYEDLKGEKKEAETVAVTKEEEKQKNGFKKEKQLDSIDNKTEKSQDITEGEEGGKKKDSKKDNQDSNLQDMKKEASPLPPHPEVDFTIYPDMDSRVHPVMRLYSYSNNKTNPQYCYIAQPQSCAVAVPCYAIPSYPAPQLFPTWAEEHYYFDKSSSHYQPPFSRPTERMCDYFSDENTVGCHVM